MTTAQDFVTVNQLAALERTAAELRGVVLRSCGTKAPGVLALLDQAIRSAREVILAGPP